MKKGKRRFGEALSEAVCELLLTLLFFGVGALVVCLCDGNLNVLALDLEWIVLIGLAVTALIFGVVYLIVRWVKKK